MKFNVNHEVRVKLTDLGRQIHKDLFTQYHADFKSEALYREEYVPPVEDADGWSTWQLWYLMQTFGNCCSECRIPFETEIDILCDMLSVQLAMQDLCRLPT